MGIEGGTHGVDNSSNRVGLSGRNMDRDDIRGDSMARNWPVPEPTLDRGAAAGGEAGVGSHGGGGAGQPQSRGVRVLPTRSLRANDGWRDLLGAYPWPVDEALLVFACESDNFRPDVVYGPTEGAAGERGIAQLHPVHLDKFLQRGWTWDDAFNPTRNLEVAYQIWADQGWGPWTCWEVVS